MKGRKPSDLPAELPTRFWLTVNLKTAKSIGLSLPPLLLGLLTVGQTAREAFVLMKSLIEAADIQIKMEATGGDLIEIPAEICEKTARQYEHHDSGRGSADWPAYLRMLDAIDPQWRN